VIGVFDSGIGGLSVLRALRAQLPNEHFVYVADSAYAPYGERGDAYVIERSRVLTDWLVTRGAKLVVNACNTATAAAARVLREAHPNVPLVGIEPAIKPAAKLTQNGKVSVLATRGTLASDKFTLLLANIQSQYPLVDFQILPCDGLAEAIEFQSPGSAEADRERVLQMSQAPAQAVHWHGADVVVLGCTHYPLVADWLATQLPSGVTLLDPAPAVALQVERQLAQLGLSNAGQGGLELFTTGEPQALQAAAHRWLGQTLAVGKV
jgi:glutamate racemase